MNLDQISAVLKPDLTVEKIPVSPSIYQESDEKFDLFKSHVLIATHTFDKNWGMWERHPAGDEIVVLLSGSARMVIRLASGEESNTQLEKVSDFVVIPKGVWHTAQIIETTKMLFITPGENTENQVDISD